MALEGERPRPPSRTREEGLGKGPDCGNWPPLQKALEWKVHRAISEFQSCAPVEDALRQPKEEVSHLEALT